MGDGLKSERLKLWPIYGYWLTSFHCCHQKHFFTVNLFYDQRLKFVNFYALQLDLVAVYGQRLTHWDPHYH